MTRAEHPPDLRERALALGVECLADTDLLALVLGTGDAREPALCLAARVLANAGGLEHMVDLGAHGLLEQRGIGPAKAARIAGALELGARALRRRLASDRAIFASFDAVASWARPRLAALAHEEVWLLGLDGKNALIRADRVAQGGLHGCALTPRDILRPALRHAASAIVLVHNHPSGDPTPSPDDRTMTQALVRAAEVVGVPVLDHVVVARGGSASVMDDG